MSWLIANLTMCDTWLGKVLAILFQTNVEIFRPFLRHGFGRRFFSLHRAILAPFCMFLLAVLVRENFPAALIYAPLQFIPPYGSWPEYQALIASKESGISHEESIFFGGFAVIVLTLWLIHGALLRIAILRKRDSVRTIYFGTSWLGQLPVLRELPLGVIQSVAEPLLVFFIGYAFCAFAPAFGLYVMSGALLLAVEFSAFWRRETHKVLDARDAMVTASLQEQYQARAEEFIQQLFELAQGALVPVTQIQGQPHQLLALDEHPRANQIRGHIQKILEFGEEETREVYDELGPELFDKLVSFLPSQRRQEVHSRIAERMPFKPATAQSA